MKGLCTDQVLFVRLLMVKVPLMATYLQEANEFTFELGGLEGRVRG